MSSQTSCGTGTTTTIRYGAGPLPAPEAERPLGNIFLPEASTVASSPWVWGFGPWELGQRQAEARVIRPESARLEQLLGNTYRKCQPISKFFVFLPCFRARCGNVPGSTPKMVDA